MNNYVIENTLKDDYFVGIKIIDDKFHLYFPMGYQYHSNKDDELDKQSIMFLLKTVMLTQSINGDRNNEPHNKDEKIIPMGSYIYILSDYYSNGMYQYNEKRYRDDTRGKINWKKTYKNSFFLQDEQPIYLNTVIQYNKKETNLITLLQLFCVSEATKVLFFLGDYSSPYSPLKKTDIENNKKYYNNFIDKEINSTNNDRKKLLLTHIKNILNDCSIGDKYTRSFGTRCYEYAFEKMINRVFGNVDILSEYYPTAEWTIDGEGPISSSKMREDTINIIDEQKKAYVIDSKYYRYGILKDNSLLPNTKNVCKQIVYGDYVKKLLKEKTKKDFDVYNVFFIPYDGNDFIKYKGNAKMKLGNDEVHLCLINMNELIETYFSVECKKINDLIEVLQDNK